MTDYYHSIKTYPVQLKVPLSHSGRGYRIFQLTNGILTLLISDPSKEIGAASLCVATGSHNDPQEIPGLAHLCEHTLFLGTKEFPKPNSYHESVLACGGRTNAFTTGEQTCFHFEIPIIIANTKDLVKYNKRENVDEPIFDRILRNFASFFRRPSFHESDIRSEILSVNDEHMSNINLPEKIFFHALKILSNRAHPFSRFATGNIYSLEKYPKSLRVDLYSELLKFYQTYYVPERMTLVISGPQSLNHLQRLSLMNFTDIHQKLNKIKYPDIEILKYNLSEFSILHESWSKVYIEPVFKESNLNQCIFVKSDNHSRLRITFPVTPTKSRKEYKLYQKTWINILGDESIGTLCAYLIDFENLATSVYMFGQSLTFQDDILILDIKLTNRGKKSIQKIVVAIFQYINQVILNCSYKIMGHYLSEMTTIEQLNFIYEDPIESPMNEAEVLTEILQKDLSIINPANILKGSNDWVDTNLNYNGDYKTDPTWWRLMAAKFIVATMKTLNSNNCNISVMDSNPLIIDCITNDSPISKFPDKRDLYYKFEYAIRSLNQSLINNESLKNCSYFSFPKPNAYLNHTQEELNDIIERVSAETAVTPLGFQTMKTMKTLTAVEPILIEVSQFHEVWRKVDETTSRVAASCRVQSRLLKPSPVVTIGIEILSELIGNKLRHELYPGELMGYSWGVFPSVNGSSSITLIVSGLKDSFCTFLFSIAGIFQEIVSDLETMPYSVFMKARVSVRKHYQNFLKCRGLEKAMAASMVFLEEGIWSLEQRLEALEVVDINILKKICMNLLWELKYTTIFVQGNIEIDETLKISEAFQSLSKYQNKSNPNTSIKELSSYLMRQGKRYVYEHKGSNNDSFNTIFYYIQIGSREDSYNRTITKFTAYFLSIFAATELRTKRQLGYFVSSGFRLFRTTLGVYISISSGTYDPHYLNSQIEDFLYELELMLYDYTEVEFEILKKQFVESYSKQKCLNDLSPSNEIYGVKPTNSSSTIPHGMLYNIHRNCFEKIVNKTYRFGGLNGEDEINLQFINELTKNQFFEFFKSKLSIKSKVKSSLSLQFFSRICQNELKMKNLKIQVLECLKEAGILVSDNDLEIILRKFDNNNTLIPSEANGNIKTKSEWSKFIMRTLKKTCREKFEYFTSTKGHSINDHGVRKVRRNNIVKVLGEDYFSNKPILAQTILKSWKQLHVDSILQRNTPKVNLFEKLERY